MVGGIVETVEYCLFQQLIAKEQVMKASIPERSLTCVRQSALGTTILWGAGAHVRDRTPRPKDARQRTTYILWWPPMEESTPSPTLMQILVFFGDLRE